MSYLYVNENGSQISLAENYVTVRYRDGMIKKIPIETLESVSIFGASQITTQCVTEFLRRGIPVVYYSKSGAYYGRLHSTGHINAARQRLQAAMQGTDFQLQFCKKIIHAKIHNQLILVKRYERSTQKENGQEIKMIRIADSKLDGCNSIEQIMGYEGMAAKYYFQALSNMGKEEFKFSGRSKRPPKDEFNSMLSLGYSILLNEIYGKIEAGGLNPYFGIMHQDKEMHPTFASDLMEEWRAVIVDSMVMSLVNGHEIYKEHFYTSEEQPGYFLTKEGMKIFLSKMEKKLRTENSYLDYVNYSVSFRQGMELQVRQFLKALEEQDVSLYHPVMIR